MTTAFWVSGAKDPDSNTRSFGAWKSAGLCLWFGAFCGLAERVCYHFSPAPLGVDDLWWAALADLIFFSLLAVLFFALCLLMRRVRFELVAFFVCAALLMAECISIASPAPGHAARGSIAALISATVLTFVFSLVRRPVTWFGAVTLPVLALYLLIYLAAAPTQRKESESAHASAQPGAPNVLLIIVDTLEADHLSTYGYARLT